MADGAGHPSASELVEVARRDLADVEREIRSHRFFAALDNGRVPRERLGEFAGEQYAILSSDRRSFLKRVVGCTGVRRAAGAGEGGWARAAAYQGVTATAWRWR